MTSSLAKLIGVAVIYIFYGLWKAIVAIFEWIGNLLNAPSKRKEEEAKNLLAEQQRKEWEKKRKEAEEKRRIERAEAERKLKIKQMDEVLRHKVARR